MKLIKGIEFTDREYDVITCLIDGKTAKSVGVILKIYPNTVNVHIRNIAFRIQRNNKNDIIMFAESACEYESLRKRYDELIGNPVSFDNLQERAHNFFCKRVQTFFYGYPHRLKPMVPIQACKAD